ncbi:MAG: DsbA family protein, partial [Nitrospinota bacterium]
MKEHYGDRVRVEHRSFLLRPEPDPGRTFNDYRRRHWALAGAQPEAGEFRLWESGEEFPKCSLPSAEAGKCAQAQGEEAWDRYHMALLRAHFWENRNIDEPSVLVEVAERVGLDAERFREDLASGRPREQALREHWEAVARYGITGIPTVVVN